MRKEMADNISEIEVKIPKETLVDKALSKVPKRLVRIGTAVGIASGAALGGIKPVEAKLDLNEKPGIPSIVLPEIKETKELQEIHKVDQLKTFPLTQKEKDMISSGNITPELGSNLDKANKALVEEYKPIESVTQAEVAYNKDTGEGAVYLRFNKLQPTKDADGKEIDFTPGSVIYSGGHYMVQKEGQIVSAVIVDDKTKNFFEEVNTEDGKVQTPEVGSIIIVAKDAKTENTDSFITGDKRYDMTDIQNAPSFSTPDAVRAKMGNAESSNKTAWEKAGVSKDIYMSYLNFAMQQLPDSLQERMHLKPEDTNVITFDFQRMGFVDAKGRVWRPNLTEDKKDTEAGWVTEFDKYYSKENNTYIILEGNPDKLSTRKTGTKFKDLDFTDDFKKRIDDWISKYGTKLKGQIVHLTFVDGYSKKSDTDFATPTLGSGNQILEALKGSHFGYQKFVHIYSFGQFSSGGTTFTNETMFSNAIVDGLVLANNGFEGIAVANAIYTQKGYEDSANFLAPGLGSRPAKNTTSSVVRIVS